ncbi:IS30 family transposase, partial [Salinibacterium sp. ZJ454]|uniref:IS30 family transposase n=1 Tax=Salinibacterium sp. ZJ454 TaxID=2708339 RepID=UPI0014227444
MKRKFGPAERERFFELMAAGLSMNAASAVVGASRGAVRRWWAQSGPMTPLRMGPHGGMAEPVPPPREKSGRSLSSEDRAVIQAGLGQRLPLSQIGALIDRDKSVVSREIRRNRGPDGVYRARIADRLAGSRRARPKPFKLAVNELLCRRIAAWMDQGWSPRLIADMLSRTAGKDQTSRVSHETIYQALYVQTRGNLRADLNQQLSLKRRSRVSRSSRANPKNPYREAFTISQRPAEAADRAVPGHWEGDLIIGGGNRSA